jgi:hypothetical protein
MKAVSRLHFKYRVALGWVVAQLYLPRASRVEVSVGKPSALTLLLQLLFTLRGGSVHEFNLPF